MKIVKADLDSAVQQGIITDKQSEKLWSHFESLRPDQPKFQALDVLYYFGGLLVIGSMSWFMSLAWDSGGGLMLLSALFASLYAFIGNHLWHKQGMKIPGGLLITAVVSLVPLFIYGFQKATGLWPQDLPGPYHDYYLWVKGSWFFMELGTILAALIALRFYPFSFLTFPIAFSLWFMAMDLTPLLFGKTDFSLQERCWVSCIFGLLMLFISYFIDKKFKEIDFAFWTYLFGLMAFWGGLTMMQSNSELWNLIYCLLNIGLMILSVYLHRKVFLVFGVLGVFTYIGHLAYEVFKDSDIFPFVLAFAGLLIIFLGVKYKNNREWIDAKIEGWIPPLLMKWRPEERP